MVKNAGTVVIVSHSFGMLSEICDRIVLIDKGEIIADGLPQDSIAKYYSNTKNREMMEALPYSILQQCRG